MNNAISEQFERALAELCTDDRVRDIEAGADAAGLWAEVDALGFTDALVPEHRGGSGLSLAQCAPLIVAAGRAGPSHPFGETMAARALLASAGHDPGASCIALAGAVPDEGNTIVCRDVPGARLASAVLVQWRDTWLLLPHVKARQEPGSLRPRASATLHWDSADDAVSRWPVAGASAENFCNAVHAAAMSGAMERTLEFSVRYAGDRRQFGRPIARPQPQAHARTPVRHGLR